MEIFGILKIAEIEVQIITTKLLYKSQNSMLNPFSFQFKSKKVCDSLEKMKAVPSNCSNECNVMDLIRGLLGTQGNTNCFL